MRSAPEGSVSASGRAVSVMGNKPFRTQFCFHLVLSSENGAKTRLAAHHVLVRFRRALQWKELVHRPHTGEPAERKRILRIDGAAGGPSHDRPAPHEHETSIDFERLIGSTHYD